MIREREFVCGGARVCEREINGIMGVRERVWVCERERVRVREKWSERQ